MGKVFECLIIGCGPCGIGASLKLKEAGVDFAIIEKSAPGGKVNIAPRVDNYPGFTKIPGPDLAFALYERALKAGVEIIGDEVTSLTKEGDIFVLKGLNETYKAKTVLIACGTTERKLGLDEKKEDFLLGRGLSYCAVCDGHFFKGVDVAVVGGGNSALKEAIYLADIAKHVYLLHRRNEFRGNPKNVEELKSLENVTILTPYIPLEIIGEEKVEGLRIQNKETLEEKVLVIQGLFPLVGQDPNSTFIDIEGVKDEWGTIPTNMKTMETSVKGLFAGGDILPRPLRQIYLAEHDGVVASKAIIEYLGK